MLTSVLTQTIAILVRFLICARLHEIEKAEDNPGDEASYMKPHWYISTGCTYNGQTYANGETFPDKDNCNTW